MIYSHEVEEMCPVALGVNHGAAPIPEEALWVKAKEVSDISGLSHGIGWCAPQQGGCKLTLNVKKGVIQEALVETLGCSGMTHSAAMASEILPGRTILEALNTDLVCDAINTAMREIFLQLVYGRTQSAFSEDGLAIGAGLEDLGKGLRSQIGTMYGTLKKGPRYLEMAEGYVTGIALNEDNEIIGYQFINFGKMMDYIKDGDDAQTAMDKAKGQYGRVDDAVIREGTYSQSLIDTNRLIYQTTFMADIPSLQQSYYVKDLYSPLPVEQSGLYDYTVQITCPTSSQLIYQPFDCVDRISYEQTGVRK